MATISYTINDMRSSFGLIDTPEAARKLAIRAWDIFEDWERRMETTCTEETIMDIYDVINPSLKQETLKRPAEMDLKTFERAVEGWRANRFWNAVGLDYPEAFKEVSDNRRLVRHAWAVSPEFEVSRLSFADHDVQPAKVPGIVATKPRTGSCR